jgi:hypothetical protein
MIFLDLILVTLVLTLLPIKLSTERVSTASLCKLGFILKYGAIAERKHTSPLAHTPYTEDIEVCLFVKGDAEGLKEKAKDQGINVIKEVKNKERKRDIEKIRMT